jgi:hypothetical protein
MADSIVINVKVNDNEVGPKTRQIRDALKGAFRDAERSAKQFGGANTDALKSLERIASFSFARRGGRIAGELAGAEVGTRRLIEGMHALHPVLESVGLGIGNLRGFGGGALRFRRPRRGHRRRHPGRAGEILRQDRRGQEKGQRPRGHRRRL